MSPSVVRGMTWLAAIILAIGFALPSPTAQHACAWMSGICATSALAFGSSTFKAIGMAIIAGAVWLTTLAFPTAAALVH